MSNESEEGITVLLYKARQGDHAAGIRVFELLYQEMRRIARGHLAQERPNHTFQPTALVNEAYLRIFGDHLPTFEDRAHFLAVVSRIMRLLLVDYARARNAEKRGSNFQKVSLDDVLVISNEDWPKLLILNDAMERLANWDSRQCQIVEMRFFGGLTEEEIAKALGISSRTVKRDWDHAKAWLRGELASVDGRSEQP